MEIEIENCCKNNRQKESTDRITLVFVCSFNLLAENEALSSSDLQKVEVQYVKNLYSSNRLKFSIAKDHFFIHISFNHSVVLLCLGCGLHGVLTTLTQLSKSNKASFVAQETELPFTAAKKHRGGTLFPACRAVYIFYHNSSPVSFMSKNDFIET